MEKLYRLLAAQPRWALIAFAVCLYLLCLYLGGIQTAVRALPGREMHSKIYHMVFYFGLGGLAWFCCRRPTILKATAFVALAGALDETHQYFLAFRHARYSDIAIDTAAGLCAALLLYWVSRRVASRQK